MRAKFINEEFREESDPIEDLEIGIMKFFKDALIQKGKQSSMSGSKKYFGDKAHTNESYTIFLILKNIVENNIGSAEARMKAANNIIKKRGNTKEGIESLKKVLKKHFYIDLYKSVNEEFREESDPIEDLEIGTKEVYQHLKRGDVIRVKKTIVMKGESGTVYPIGYYILLLEAKGGQTWRFNKNITYNGYKNEKDFKNNIIDKRNGWIWVYEFFKEYFEKVGHKRLKKSLNETFAENSDPITDLGIGGTNLNKEFQRKLNILIKNTYKEVKNLQGKTVTGKMWKDGRQIK